MKWQWKIGTFAGIDVYIHATFLLIIGWVGLSHWFASRTFGAVLSGIVFILALFLMVVLHEYGHALTARRFGVKTRDITLYPIGGIARLERMPDKPIQEFWVAVMGPVVNLVIAILLFLFLLLTDGLVPFSELTLTSGSLLERLMIANLSLVVFNMLPAFPMDGGRVLRALLALRLEYTQATQIAAGIGQGMAFLFGFWGLFNNPFLLFIAFFVWMGASQEANLALVKSALGGIPVSRVMMTNFQVTRPEDSLERVVQLLLAGSQQDFPVMEDGRVLGMVCRDDFIAGLSSRGQQGLVIEIMRQNLPEVDSHDMIETAMLRLAETGFKALPVTHAGQMVGMISSENISEFLMIKSALKQAPQVAAG